MFQVYVCCVDADPQLAASRNIHKRTAEEVAKLSKSFEETPGMLKFFYNLILLYAFPKVT